MSINITKLKREIDVREYYQNELACSNFKHTKNGLYKTNTLCPFHADKYAGSFCVNLRTGKFYCFACNAKGDFIDFHMQKHGLSMSEAINQLGRDYLCKK